MRYLRNSEEKLFQRIISVCVEQHLSTSSLTASFDAFEGESGTCYFPAISIDAGNDLLDCIHTFRLWYSAQAANGHLDLTAASATQEASNMLVRFRCWVADSGLNEYEIHQLS